MSNRKIYKAKGLEFPACWRWTVRTEDFANAHSARGVAEGLAALWVWQAGRCAICGGTDVELVLDHDHETGLIRGLLCYSCNGAEGRGHSGHPVFAHYRAISPASILDMKVRHAGRRNVLDGWKRDPYALAV